MILDEHGRPAEVDTAVAKFYLHPLPNAEKTREAGYEVCDDVLYIEIRKPGDRNLVVKRKATDEDKRRFASTYDAFEAGEQEPMHGMPLAHWPQISPAQVNFLKMNGVKTLEQFIELPGHQASGLGRGIAELQAKAKRYVEAASGPGVVSEKMTKLEDQILLLQEQIKAMDFDAKPGSFNVLNVPDELYVDPKQFFDDYNEGWLRTAIERGDRIVLATKPTDQVLSYKDRNGNILRTGFGREYDLLVSEGFQFDEELMEMVRK